MKIDQSKWKYCRDNWRKNNPDYSKTYYKEVICKDSERIAKNLERSKKWQKENKEKASNNHIRYIKKRIENDPLFKFKHVTRSLIKKSFTRVLTNKFKKKNKSEEILGCSLEFFKDYILSKCPKGAKIEDFGQYGYHIDHIIPISTAASEEEVLKLNHYSNFQPLWWKENLSKSDKILI